MGFGAVFLLALYILSNDGSKKWLLYFTVFYFILQFSFKEHNFRYAIDYFFGPFVILVMLDIIVNRRLPSNLLKRYYKRFYLLLWLPIIIAIFQYFEVLPLTFWNATYVNATLVDGVSVSRVNGFLYHGSELSIIICYVCLFQYFRTETKAFWMLLLLILIASITYFKTILVCTILIFIHYMLFVNKGPLSQYKLFSRDRIYWYGGIVLAILVALVYNTFSKIHDYTGHYFDPQMLTGRGGIWNIYIEAIKSFGIKNYLFGTGFGSEYDLFRVYANSTSYVPKGSIKKLETLYNSHNALLNIFVNAGIIGLALFFFLFKMIYNQIIQWSPSKKWNKAVFFGIFIIPLVTIGMTIVIYETAIIWPCLGFLLFRWYFHHNQMKLDEN